MKNTAIERITKQKAYLEANIDRLVMDADTHATDVDGMIPALKQRLDEEHNYYQGRPISAEDLIREMNMAGVDMALIWQNPACTPYSTDLEKNFESLMKANKYIHDTAVKHFDRFIPAGWTDPKALGIELAQKVVEICVLEYGFTVVKMNPAQNAYPIDSDMVFVVLDKIISLGAIPAFHYGGDTPYTPAAGLGRVAEKYPDSPILAVHMGGGGAGYLEAEQQYHETRALGLKHPNIKYILSAKRDTHIESDLVTYQLAGEPFSNNIFCASDAPYGRMTWNFGGYRWMFQSLIDSANHTDERVRKNPGLFDEEAKKNYMGRNFARFIIEGYKKLLDIHTK